MLEEHSYLSGGTGGGGLLAWRQITCRLILWMPDKQMEAVIPNSPF